MRDEAMVEIDEPEKSFELLLGLGALEVSDGGDAVFQWCDTSCRDVVSEEGEAVHAEGALGGVEKHTVAGESAEDFPKVLDVLCDVGAGDQNVIHVHKDEVEAAEDVIHESLERLRAVAQSVRHAQELERPEGCGDGCLQDVVWSHGNLVEGPDEVEFCVDAGSSEAGGEVVKVWERVPVGNGDAVEGTVVSTRSPISGRFGHHVKG